MAKSGGLLRLMDLPPEMLTRILLCLDRAADVVHVARTCRTWCQLAEQGQVWLHLCTQRWGSEIPVQDWLQRADSAKALFRLLSAIGPLVGVWEAQNLAPRGGLLYATWGDFGVVVYRVIPDWLDGGLMCARLFEVRGGADGRTRMLLIETKDGEEVQVPGAVVWRDSARDEFFLEKYSPVAAPVPALRLRRSASAGAHRPTGAGAWAHQLAAAGSHAVAGAGDRGFAAGRGSGPASGLGSAAAAAAAGDPQPPGTARGLLHQSAAPVPPMAAALVAAALSALPAAAVAEAIGSARAQERMEEARERGSDEKGKGIAKEAEDVDDEEDDEMFDDAEELEQLESDGEEEEGGEERSGIGSAGLPTLGVGGLAVGGGGCNALRSRAMHLLAGMLGRQDRPAGAPAAAAAAAAGVAPGLSALVAGVSGDDVGMDRSPLQAAAPFAAPAQDVAGAAVAASATVAAAAAAAAPSPPSPSGQDVSTAVGDAEDRPELLLSLQQQQQQQRQQQQRQQMQQQPMSAVEAAAWDAAAAAAVGLHSRPQQQQMEGEIGGLTPAAEEVLNNMEGVRVESVEGATREDGGCSGASVHGRGGSDNRSNEAAVTGAAEQQGMAGLLTRLASRMTGRGSKGDGAAVAASSGDGRVNSSSGRGNCDGSSRCSGGDSSSSSNVGQAPLFETQRLPSYYRRVEVIEASPGSSSSSSATGRTSSTSGVGSSSSSRSGSSKPSGIGSNSNIGPVVRVEELQGLWSGVYGPHGPEILNVTCTGGEILARKILGDPNVPCGEISFKATIASEKVAEVGTFWQHAAAMAAAIADDAAMPEDSRPPTFVRMFQGHGRIADHNFVDPQWVPGKLFIDSLGRIAFIWEDVNFLIRFKRLVLTDIVPRRYK